MNALDWIIVVLMLLSILLAAAHGFFFEFFSLAGAIGGFLIAAWGYGGLAPSYLPYVKAPAIADLAAFLTIFFVVVLLGGAMARLARWALKEMGLRWIDRLLGGAFGMVRGIIIVSAGLMAVTAFSPESPELAGSHFAGLFLVAGRGAVWMAPSEVRQKFREGLNKLRHGAGMMRTVPAKPETTGKPETK